MSEKTRTRRRNAPRVHPCILALNTNHGLWCFGIDDVVIITVGTILVALLVVGHVFAKHLLALFIDKHNLCCLLQSVVLRFGMAFSAVEPPFAAQRANRHLGVEDVFAVNKTFYRRNQTKDELQTTSQCVIDLRLTLSSKRVRVTPSRLPNAEMSHRHVSSEAMTRPSGQTWTLRHIVEV